MIRRISALAAGAVLFVGCSLPLWLIPDAPEYAEESTADAAGFRDTRAKSDSLTRVEESVDPPPTCDVPSAASAVSCPTFTSTKPRTACTADVLNDMLTCFGSKPDVARCDAARKAYPDCAACVFSEWMLDPYARLATDIDTGACLRAIAPDGACAEAWRCRRDCVVAVCGDCEAEYEFEDCSARTTAADSGACRTHAKDYAGCAEQARFAPCFPKSTSDLGAFFRGACVTGGSWSTADAAGSD